ncbi:MAG: hypothetical protein LC117_05005 [Bacteroidia bacterium]|nr:hypothetical protein [Bacteroidia bacterium]MCZ2277269.1 hypothetical protein [Bacteroidia bacterium]
MRIFIYTILFSAMLIMVTKQSVAQENVLTAGVQFRPFFTNKFFRTGAQSKDSSNVNFTITPKGGFSAGGVVRYGFTGTLSFETGINIIKRPHDLNITKTIDGNTIITTHTRFTSISYEIPVCILVFLQLSDHLFMDAGLGLSMDFYPSHLFTYGENFQQYSRRKNWMFPAVNASLGYEWRTEKSGYFYIGSSYHNPFSEIYTSTIGYYENGRYLTGQQFLLSGNYLSIDFRYFFPQDPLKKQKKKH